MGVLPKWQHVKPRAWSKAQALVNGSWRVN